MGLSLETYALCNKKSQEYTDSKISSIGKGMEYKGSVSTVNDLPLTGNKKGYVYTVSSNGGEYVWTIDATSGTIDNWESISGSNYKVLTLDADATTKQIKDIQGNVMTYNDIYKFITDKTISVVIIVSNCIACYPVAYDESSIEFSNIYMRENEPYFDRVIINTSNEVLYNENVIVSKDNLKTVNGSTIYGVGGGNVAVTTYQPYPSSFDTSATSIDAFCKSINDTPSATTGMAYSGTITNENIFTGFNMPKTIEVNVQIMGTNGSKVIWLIATSADYHPYHWELTYYGGKTEGWRPLIAMPTIPSDFSSSTYVLKFVKGTATWVKES